MTKSGRREKKEVNGRKNTHSKFESELDSLFKLPLAEFTGSRNTLAAQMKKEGRANDAELVKTLAKPSVSAWAVNQLYWTHRVEFDQLLVAGERFRSAQSTTHARKVADMRESLDARRIALSKLSDLASDLLREAGHNPSPDTIHRITTTLEAVSASPDGPTLGRLTQDVDPPGFESLAAFVPGTFTPRRAADQRPSPPPKKTQTLAPEQRKSQGREDQKARKLEETRQAKIAATKASLQFARKSLTDARAKVQSLELQQKKAYSEAKDAEQRKRFAEQQLKRASVASEEASERSNSIAKELSAAKKTMEDVKRLLDKETRELESLFRESAER